MNLVSVVGITIYSSCIVRMNEMKNLFHSLSQCKMHFLIQIFLN